MAEKERREEKRKASSSIKESADKQSKATNMFKRLFASLEVEKLDN